MLAGLIHKQRSLLCVTAVHDAAIDSFYKATSNYMQCIPCFVNKFVARSKLKLT